MTPGSIHTHGPDRNDPASWQDLTESDADGIQHLRRDRRQRIAFIERPFDISWHAEALHNVRSTAEYDQVWVRAFARCASNARCQ
jgi:hypothetical protein